MLTVEELVVLCKEWQAILNIQFWDIKVGIYRGRDFSKKEIQAEVSFQLATATAILRILDPTDYDRDLWPQDMEVSMVHELLHLRLAEADETESGSMEDILLERAIDHIAKALVKLKRGGLNNG